MKRAAVMFSAVAIAVFTRPSHADSVAQIQTAKRITAQTIEIIDPQGGTSTGGAGSNVNYAVGDILTFQFRFTPVENGATRGLGGYITEYVPANTEVVGARIVDAQGNTVCPHRGGLAAIGWGPRGSKSYAAAAFPTCPAPGCFQGQGGMSSLYADTGVFYSTDPRTARIPTTDFITVFNGAQMPCNPTGAGQLDDLLAANIGGPYFAHNLWDNIQVRAFGCSNATSGNGGTGNTPFGYGSAVAGPESFYPFEATDVGGVVRTAGNVGPWHRVRTACAEIGTGVPATQAGPVADRLGVPTDGGFNLSPSNPLPAGTNAVRFAVGELVVGDEYLAEVSLRVRAAPLDPVMNADVNCSEVFGGDASARRRDGTDGGKDNTWRYFLPAPACVSLNLQFDLDVDKIQILSGDTITYTLTIKNLDAVTTHTNTVVSLDLGAGVGTANFVSATNGGTAAGGVVTWPAATLAPGDRLVHTVVATGTGTASPIVARARYVSSQLPAPGFSVVSLTNIGALAIPRLSLAAMPTSTTAGGTVTYTATIRNVGTGVANFGCADCGVTVTLPPTFSVVPGTVFVDGVAAGNPVATAPDYRFTAGLTSVPPGGTVTLRFDALVAAGTAPGVYRSDLSTFLNDPGAGRNIEDAIAAVAPVLVDVVQSDRPTVSAPLVQGGTIVCGTSTEPNGTTIRVFVDMLAVGTATVSGGSWCATVPGLIAGQDVAATAQNTAAGEVESGLSAPPVEVIGGSGGVVPACNDGVDNDGDGAIDFPADTGCVNASDVDETNIPQCSNGRDDDGDGATDFPNDPSCSSFTDNDESGPPACSDGSDNDGDGLVDIADPGCTGASDVSEADLPQCANGIDDDGDTAIDYPFDLGCASAGDDDESGGGGGPVDAGMVDASPPDALDGGATDFPDAAEPNDPGGVDAPGGGCCGASGPADITGLIALALLTAALLTRPRVRRSRVKGSRSPTSEWRR